MNYTQAIEYIHSVCWLGSRPGLSRITELCNKLGNIQDNLKFIHIAGTNGKGSVSAMLTEICKNSGLRVGSFTSPYVYRFNERMTINNEPISDSDLADIIKKIKPLADSMEDSPTEFELITAAGFLYFHEKKCDLVILETGMGGRLDSTNIIKTPLLSIITSIALDHTAFLGDTEEKIATEKSGIIKKNIPILYGKMSRSCSDIIQRSALENETTAIPCDYDRLKNISLSLDGCSFNIENYTEQFKLKLVGGYQPYNALLAVTAAEILKLPQDAIYKGLSQTKWRARFEVLSKDPCIIYDGGHNPHGVKATVETVKTLFGKKVNIFSGVMQDKDYKLIAELLSDIAHHVYCVTPDNPRALPASKYAETFISKGVEATAIDDFSKAVKIAYANSKKENRPLIALGSLYMYKEFIDNLGNV